MGVLTESHGNRVQSVSASTMCIGCWNDARVLIGGRVRMIVGSGFLVLPLDASVDTLSRVSGG